MFSRRLTIGASAALGAILVVLAFVFVSPDASYATKRIHFEFSGDTISGQISMPHDASHQPLNCVVFVHGDGEMDAAALGYFTPYFSQFAQRGWCSFSWDKPGVGRSTGQWLDYSMADRARLVEEAIKALRNNQQVAIGKIGLIGFSQAGWVMPKVAETADLAFLVFVSPAINWMEQSHYMTALRRSATPDAPAKMAAEAELDALIAAGAPYDAYLALSEQSDFVAKKDFSKARWGFVARNAGADATQDLKNMPAVPTLLLVGGRDGQVDAQQTVDVYQVALPKTRLGVQWFDEAGHSMLAVDERKVMDGEDGLWLLARIVMWGSEAFVEGYWTALNGFIAAQFVD